MPVSGQHQGSTALPFPCLQVPRQALVPITCVLVLLLTTDIGVACAQSSMSAKIAPGPTVDHAAWPPSQHSTPDRDTHNRLLH